MVEMGDHIEQPLTGSMLLPSMPGRPVVFRLSSISLGGSLFG